MEEEWRQCLKWLVRCSAIPGHSPVITACEPIELAQALKDGIVLCNLLNYLHPGCIGPKDISTRPQMAQKFQFRDVKNIRLFLQTARHTFGLAESDLFQPEALYDFQDFRKVIQMLSKLSWTDKAKRKTQPFPPEKMHQFADHDYYNLLEDIATQSEFDDFEETHADEDEDIYDTLCAVRRCVESRQSDQPKTKRDFCVRELVETESNYVDALNMMIKHFVRPLSSVMEKEKHELIFKHIEHLAEVHTGFHAELRRACSSTAQHNKPQISEVFLRWKQRLLVYGDFCSNLPHAQEQLEEMCKRSEIIRQSVLECQMKANGNKFKLHDLLAFPMQRVLKYHLLLKELLKNTGDTHEDKDGLEAALDAVNDLSLYINEVKRDNESLQLIAEIQDSIMELFMPENTQLKDYGHLLKDGELKVKSHDDQRLKARYIFLFDKVMLMCKSKGENYSFKDAIVLTQYVVEEVPRSTKPKLDKWNAAFQLTERSKKNAFTFLAKTDELRDKWIDAIKMAIMNTAPPGATDGKHEFCMHTFSTPTECDVCHKLLRGVFHQGYKCSRTGMAVHKECICKANSPNKRTPGIPPRLPAQTGGQRKISQSSLNGNVGEKRSVRAIAAYQGIPPPDGRTFLTFSTGDVIDVVHTDDPNWWLGRLRGSEGYFPKTYVEEYTRSRTSGRGSYLESDQSFERSTEPSRPISMHSTHELDRYPWFGGLMERDQAVTLLRPKQNGAYLIRESTNPARRGEFALSIKFGHNVKHIRVNRGADGGGFSLVESRKLPTLVELVEYYSNNSLQDFFPDLQTRLLFPFKTASAQASAHSLQSASRAVSRGSPAIGYCIASYDYAATQPNQLSMKYGDRLAIISKVGGDRGWWKGRQENGKEGYFPHAYVQEEELR